MVLPVYILSLIHISVEAVDAAVNEVVTAVLNAGGCVFLTDDHGNAEKMTNPDGTPFTAHTTNPVPFVTIGCGDVKLREGGCLADIAPTMLQMCIRDSGWTACSRVPKP